MLYCIRVIRLLSKGGGGHLTYPVQRTGYGRKKGLALVLGVGEGIEDANDIETITQRGSDNYPFSPAVFASSYCSILFF